MAESLYWLEKGFLVFGVVFVLTGIMHYGKRSQDWKGIVTMFYRRVPLSIAEYKWYRLGIALVFFAVVLRIVGLTLWP
ncbi:hypothetical protein [Vibrio sp. MA40-2]|uniref:hypothetical protein n=1 Tax=Vibrio sp. MA40-2 TaxID=3391828 RepID=UPI0039A6ADA3